jgi:hypothetical protein
MELMDRHLLDKTIDGDFDKGPVALKREAEQTGRPAEPGLPPSSLNGA